jgi:uncharacterized membrane protein (DUF106 family)
MTPFITITLLSLGLSAAITAIYRVLIKPEKMRKMKDDMKFYKEKMNESKKAGDMAKMNEYATEMLKASQGQFRLTMKPMLATMLMFFLLLGWLNANFGGVSADFSGGKQPRFLYGGGNYTMAYDNATEGGFTVYVDFDGSGSYADGGAKPEVFREGQVYEMDGAYWRPVQATTGFLFFQTPKSGAVRFDMLIAKSPVEIPLIGGYLTWFWWYLFLSVPSTIAFRKIAGVE